MMEKRREEKRREEKRREGFTLAELLIVVAIVSILVAISIPLFRGKLCKVRIATNTANMRAAKAAAISEYLTEGERGAVSYLYDVNQGTVKIAGKDVDVSNTDEKGIYPFILVTIDGESVTVEPTKECVNQCKVTKGNVTPTIPDVDLDRGTTDIGDSAIEESENQKPPQPPQPPIIMPTVW